LNINFRKRPCLSIHQFLGIQHATELYLVQHGFPRFPPTA
jgi:hypothetical protein